MNDTTVGEAPGSQAANPATGSGPVVGDDAAAKPASIVDQVKDHVASTASDQKDGIADRLEDVAEAVHRSGEQFAGKQDWIAGAIERGASELTALAGSLREADIGTIVQQVQVFARRQPGLFVGASLAAGFALARFGKVVAKDVSRDDLPTIGGQHDQG